MKDLSYPYRRFVLTMLLALPASLPALENTWLIDGSFSGLVGRDPLRLDDPNTQTDGAQINFYIMPIIGWKNSRFFLSPSFDMTYSGVNTPLEVDDDLFLFSQQVSTLFEFGGTFKSTADVRWTSKLFFENFSGKLTKDEEWGKGLYDYKDAGIFMDWTRKWNTGFPTKSTLGYRYTDRQYTNFTSLDETAVREKDALINKIYGDYKILWPSRNLFTTTISYSFQKMDFTELRIIDESGTQLKKDGSPTDFRKDTIHSVAVTMPLDVKRHNFFFAYSAEIRRSNLAEFDSQEFLYIPRFNDYAEHAVTMGYGYQFKKWWFLKSPYAGMQVTSLVRSYPGRLAQDKNGAYKDEKQQDRQAQFNLDLNSTLTEHWGLFWNFNNTRYNSNNDNEGSSLYNYRFITTSFGLQFSY